MKAHMFYLAILIITLVGLAIFLPQNMITSYSTCEGCNELCNETTQCNEGLVCCPSSWESGVCQKSNSCAAIEDISSRQSYKEFSQPEPPFAIKNIAWKTFFLPLLLVGIVIFAFRRKH